MNEPLLGCPHCGKPVGFSPAMARQVVSCPHCRGQFQMPDRPLHTSPAAAPQGRVSQGPPDLGLTFENAGLAPGATVRAELDSYRAAATLATIFAITGSVGILILLGLVVFTYAIPIFRGNEEQAGRTWAGLVWLAGSFLFASLIIIGLFLVRSSVLVLVDAARTLRAIERDAAAVRKTK